MKTVPLPAQWLRVGRRIPVDVRTADGRLLLGRDQLLASAQQREALLAHQPCVGEVEAAAWRRAHERAVQRHLHEGSALLDLRELPMPEQVDDADYVDAQPLSGGWPDLLDALQTLLDHGEHRVAPLARLRGLEEQLHALRHADPDRALFELMQALADTASPRCAAHALLCAVLVAMTADKLAWPPAARDTVIRAALLMNLGMARQYDMLARQKQPPDEAQRAIIREHASLSVQRCQAMAVHDDAALTLIRWHHAQPPTPLAPAMQSALELLRVTDRLVAQLAARATRRAISTLQAVRTLVLDALQPGQTPGAALATVLGFYPPGSYVRLANGETAVVLARGGRAHQPLVASILDGHGLALARPQGHNSAQAGYAVQSAVDARTMTVRLNTDRLMALRDEARKTSSPGLAGG